MNQLSDRELDAKVARFMDWEPIPNEDGWRSADEQSKHWPGPPYFSTEIKAAMEVVEKMRERGLWMIMGNRKGKPYWYVDFVSPTRQFEPVEAYNKSLPRAICEAALAAIETK